MNGNTTKNRPSGGRWWVRVGIPLALLAAFAGVAAGGFRWAAGFIPGLYGMFMGGLLAWMAGRLAGRSHPAQWWMPAQRFWLWLNMALTGALAALATLSVLNARPLGGPLEWAGDVARGLDREYFVGASIWNPTEGFMEGGAWVAINALDLVLLFAAGLIVLGVVVEKRLGVDRRGAGRVPPRVAGRPAGRLPARRFFCIQWIVLALLLAGVTAQSRSTGPVRYDAAAMARLESLVGRYVFDDGRNLLGPADQGGAFSFKIFGGDGLIGTFEPDGRHVIRIDYDGRNSRGRILRGGSPPVHIRTRFSKDGRHLSLAGPVHLQGTYVGDVMVTARRE